MKRTGQRVGPGPGAAGVAPAAPVASATVGPGAEEERAFLLRSLDDLDEELAAGNLDAQTYATLRADYVARAALLSRGELPAGARLPAPRWRWVVVAALVGFVAFAALVLARTVGARLPGQPVSGRAPEVAAVGARERALEAAVRARPDDPGAHLALARFLLARRRYPAALRAFDDAARLDPTNAEALAYGGWIVRLAGLVDEGLGRIDRAIVADPGYPDARFFKGVILLRDRNDPAGAIPELQRYLVAAPEGPMAAPVRALLAEAVAAERAGRAGPEG